MSANSLYERFLAQVDETPDAIAILDGDRALSYRGLAREAGRLATRLAEAGVAARSLVGLRLERGAEVAIGILGILAHGCAYVPIDPGYPRERQRLIVDVARLATVVTGHEGVPVPELLPGGRERPAWELPTGTAYVIFTSGSTGRPKGVMVGHQHVLALLDACEQVYDFTPADAWSLSHSHSFDFSVWELWGALLNGARAVVVPAAAAADPWQFADLLATQRVTVLNQVPSAFSHLVGAFEERPRSLPALRYVIFGGEALRIPAVRRWTDRQCAPGAQLVNMYGITETTVHVTHCLLTEADLADDPAATPIGVALPHLRVTLMAGGQPVPPDTAGEMVVSGRSVSHGYLGQPELTAERFVARPGDAGPAYHSGDWAVADARGRLRYLGRRDRQVKVRGFRIELGEIEAVIDEHPAVAQSAVTAVARRRGEPVLVAHYACRPAMTLRPEGLRDYLAGLLPAHIVPARLERHAVLPLTQHGKVDLAALS